ncbi:MAG: WG repeat-containing protein [Ignavibacteria bacterium]|nr:WG repeat-containing protein [Ignavibacteria bacterium]
MILKKMFYIFFILFCLFDSGILTAQTDTSTGLPELIPYRKGDKWGYCDKNKRIVIPCRYDDARLFYGRKACVKIKNKYGCIDYSGNIIIPPIYDSSQDINENFAYPGEEIFLADNDKVSFFSDNFAITKLNNKYGFVDKKNEIVVPIIYDNVKPFHEGYACIQINEKWGMINQNGKLVIPLIYDDIYPFYEDRAGVELSQHWGFIDKSGKEIIPLIYNINLFPNRDLAFKNGIVILGYNLKWGVLDKLGNIVISIKYNYICEFENGLALVRVDHEKKSLFGYIDIYGTEYWEDE